MPDYRAKDALANAKLILESEARSRSLLKVLNEGSTSQDGIREIFRQCGEERVAASVVYHDINGGGGHRTIDPYEWETTGGHSGRRSSEKLWAHCHEHGETHSFIMARFFWAIKTDKQKVGGWPYLGLGVSRKKASDIGKQQTWEQTVKELSQQSVFPIEGGEEGAPGLLSEEDIKNL